MEQHVDFVCDMEREGHSYHRGLSLISGNPIKNIYEDNNKYWNKSSKWTLNYEFSGHE